MSKNEFLSKLNEYLSYELPRQMVAKNLDYYSDYIDTEVRSGRSVHEVLEDLGDPQLIARSIIDAATCGADGIPHTDDDRDFREEVYGDGGNFSDNSGYNGAGSSQNTANGSDSTRGFGDGNIRIYSGGCFSVVLIVLIVFALLSVIGLILGFLSPVLAPICIVALILWLLNRKN